MLPPHVEQGNGPLAQSAGHSVAIERAVAIEAARCRGLVAGEHAAALAPLFAALPRPAFLQPVKSSTVRTVLAGEIGGVAVHVKSFRSGALSDRARDLLRGDRGRREAANLRAAAALGLRVPEPLAHGVCDGGDGDERTCFLVTRSIAGARPFAFDLEPAVLARTGAMLRLAHDRGLLPGDLHAGNVVIDRAGEPWLLDLTSVRHGGDATPQARARGLAFFCQELDGGPLDPAAAPLLAAYGTPPLAALTPELLAQAARAVRHRALIAFGRRSARTCRHTHVPASRRGRPRQAFALLAPEPDRERLHAACRAFVAAEQPTEPLRRGRRGAVWVLDEIVVKQREQGAARRLLRAMYELHYAGVPQPAPLALSTFAGTGHVFARRLHAPSLRDEFAAGVLDGAQCVAAARRLGDAVGRLHAHGLRNRDLKLENLVRDPATGAVAMVDLDGVRRKAPDDTRGQGRDLGRLLAAFRDAGSPGGRATAVAFARAYLRARQRLLQPAPRRIWRAAADRARQWASAHPSA